VLICNKKKPKVIWEEPPRCPSRRQSHWLQWKVPNFHPPKTAHSLRRSLPKSNTPLQTPPNHHPNRVPLNVSTQPFCQDAECGLTDRQTAVHCGPLWRIAERCGRLADHCGALGCMWYMYRTLRWNASIMEFGEAIKNPAYRILQTEYSGCLDISTHA